MLNNQDQFAPQQKNYKRSAKITLYIAAVSVAVAAISNIRKPKETIEDLPPIEAAREQMKGEEFTSKAMVPLIPETIIEEYKRDTLGKTEVIAAWIVEGGVPERTLKEQALAYFKFLRQKYPTAESFLMMGYISEEQKSATPPR